MPILSKSKRLKKSDDSSPEFQRVGYPKNSFDRFGDDLIERVLSFLPFEDKIRYESLSKQIQRLVYKKVEAIPNNLINISSEKFEALLNKCKFLKIIDLEKSKGISKKFGIVINNCNHLTEIRTNFSKLSNRTIEKLGQKYGTKLKTIYSYSTKSLKPKPMPQKVFTLFPELTEIGGKNIKIESLISGNDVLLKKLKKIEFNSEDNIEFLSKIIESNKYILESINLTQLTANSGPEVSNEILKLSHLKHLKVSATDGFFLIEFFNKLGKKCTKIVSIEVNVNSFDSFEPEIWSQLLNTFNRFDKLKVLLIEHSKRWGTHWGYGNQPKPISFMPNKSFKVWQNLVQFKCNSYFDETSFAALLRYVPKLQTLYCEVNHITDNTLDSLSRLTQLQKLILNSKIDNKASKECLLYFIRNSPKLKYCNFV